MSPPPDLRAILARLYPAFAPYLSGISFQTHPAGRSRYGNTLEFWGRGESDSPTPGRPTIETWGNVRPTDVAGDIVSHLLARGANPALTRYFNQFQASVTPKQLALIRGDYHGEQPWAQWLRTVGMPSFFRGYAFNQWNKRDYTPQQARLLDAMLAYLKTGLGAGGGARVG